MQQVFTIHMIQISPQRLKQDTLLDNKQPAKIMCRDDSLSQVVQKNLDGLKKGSKQASQVRWKLEASFANTMLWPTIKRYLLRTCYPKQNKYKLFIALENPHV